MSLVQDLLKLSLDKKSLIETCESNLSSEVLFHISKSRQNILSVVSFKSSDKVLEISPNCEILTSYYIDRVKEVTVVEKEEDFKNIRLNLLKKYNGVKTLSFVDSLESINDIFDKILIVLDFNLRNYNYQTIAEILTKAKKLLNREGEIYFAINNKYSMKNFSGVYEENSDRLFDSILSSNLLSDEEIKNISKSLGMSSYFYYPVPDFYFASEIYSEDYLPSIDAFKDIYHGYNKDRYVIFNDALAYNEAIRADKWSTFAPSYFVLMKEN